MNRAKFEQVFRNHLQQNQRAILDKTPDRAKVLIDILHEEHEKSFEQGLGTEESLEEIPGAYQTQISMRKLVAKGEPWGSIDMFCLGDDLMQYFEIGYWYESGNMDEHLATELDIDTDNVALMEELSQFLANFVA